MNIVGTQHDFTTEYLKILDSIVDSMKIDDKRQNDFFEVLTALVLLAETHGTTLFIIAVNILTAFQDYLKDINSKRLITYFNTFVRMEVIDFGIHKFVITITPKI